MNEIDCYRWRDRHRHIASNRDDARPKNDSEVAFPVVFDCWSQTERLGVAGIEPDRLSGVRDVVTTDRGVALTTIGSIECKNPMLRYAVLPGRIDKDSCSGLGLPTKSC